MATTQEIFDQAVERSNLNDADLVTEAQWLDWLTSLERRIFMTAARENPDFFGREGNSDARAQGATWSLSSAPSNVASVTRLEVAAITGTVADVAIGDEVNVISIRQPDVALSPRVYIRNKTITDYNSELQTDATNFVTTLKVWYSFLPPDRTTNADTLDLPEEHNQLVVIPLAAMLALRDQRPEEAQVLSAEFNLDWGTFLQQVSVFDELTIRELGQIPASSRRISEAE